MQIYELVGVNVDVIPANNGVCVQWRQHEHVNAAVADDDDNGGENADTHHGDDAVRLISWQLLRLMKKFLSLSASFCCVCARRYSCKRVD